MASGANIGITEVRFSVNSKAAGSGTRARTDTRPETAAN